MRLLVRDRRLDNTISSFQNGFVPSFLLFTLSIRQRFCRESPKMALFRHLFCFSRSLLGPADFYSILKGINKITIDLVGEWIMIKISIF